MNFLFNSQQDVTPSKPTAPSKVSIETGEKIAFAEQSLESPAFALETLTLRLARRWDSPRSDCGRRLSHWCLGQQREDPRLQPQRCERWRANEKEKEKDFSKKKRFFSQFSFLRTAGEHSSVWNALLQDETGSIVVTLWGMPAEHDTFSVGDVVELAGTLKPKKIAGDFLSGGTSSLELHIDHKAPKSFIRLAHAKPALGNLFGAVTPLATAIEQTKRGGARAAAGATWNFLVIVARIDDIVTIRRKKKGTHGSDVNNNVVTRDIHVFDRSTVKSNDVTPTLLRLWDCIVDAPRSWTAKQTVLLLECVSLHEFNGAHSIKISKASAMVAEPATPAAAALTKWFANRSVAAPTPTPAPVPTTPMPTLPQTLICAPTPAHTPVSTTPAPAPALKMMCEPTPASTSTPAPAVAVEQFTIESLRTASLTAGAGAVISGFVIAALARVHTYTNSLKFQCKLCNTAQSAAVVSDHACVACKRPFALDLPSVSLVIKVDLIDHTGSLNGIWLSDATASGAIGLADLSQLVLRTPAQRSALYRAAELERIKLCFSMHGQRLHATACATET
jgi:hypothetical protein